MNRNITISEPIWGSLCTRRTCSRKKSRGSHLCKTHQEAAKRAGLAGLVPGTETRQHVRQLMDLGWTRGAVARMAEVSKNTIYSSLKSDGQSTAKVARKILAVPLEPPNIPDSEWPGFARRIQGLRWMGWPISTIAALAGITDTPLYTSLRTQKVTPFIWGRIADLYEQISHIQGPSPRTAEAAKRRGWVSPLAWDDIDDPDEEPNLGIAKPDKQMVDSVAVENAVHGIQTKLNPAEIIEAGQVLRARGWSTNTIAIHLHINYKKCRRLLGLVAA